MVTHSNTEKILVGIDDQIVELTGEAREAFLAQRAIDLAAFETQQSELAAKAVAKAAAQAKLAALGLTVEDLQALGL